jgi:hypothetical protein
MTELEFKDGFDRLTENFGKQDAGKFRFLYQELRRLDSRTWKTVVQVILDSEFRFPVLAVFRKLVSEERSATEKNSQILSTPSCIRCNEGLCTVERYHYRRKHSFSFRCSCSSGERYPGLPLVGSTRTLKESRSVGKNPESLTVEEKSRALDQRFKEAFPTDSVLDQDGIFT